MTDQERRMIDDGQLYRRRGERRPFRVKTATDQALVMATCGEEAYWAFERDFGDFGAPLYIVDVRLSVVWQILQLRFFGTWSSADATLEVPKR